MAADLRMIFVDFEDLVLDAGGRWLSNGEEVTHAETCRAFHRHLEPDGQGGWRIRIGPETKAVRVEGTPRFVAALEGSFDQGFAAILASGAREPLRPETLAYTPPDRLTCTLANGEAARFLRAPYHELLMGAEGDGNRLTLRIQGKAFRL